MIIPVKPNAKKTEILSHDPATNTYKIAVAAVPDKGKANDELLKFLKKQFGKRFEIIAGKTSKKKIVKEL